MNVLNISSLRKSFGGRVIFDDVSFAVDETEKVGFIGVNGSGKSTLFRIVAGLEGADTGDIAVRRTARLGYLAQEPDFRAGQKIRDAVAEGRPELYAALGEYDRVGHMLASSEPDHERLVERHAALGATIDRLGGWDWNHRVESMLTQLGVVSYDRTVDGLSGGEAKRVALARTLLAQPELLLLDEPTNHLDADTVLFLENYLIEYAGAVMLITHDRYFLDRVVDRMIEVESGQLTSFPGGYTQYLEAQAARTELQATVDAKRRKLVEKELEWAKRSPPARSGKQRARIQRAESLAVDSKRFRAAQTGELTLHTPESVRLGRTVLNLHHVTKGYDGRTLIRDFDTILRAGERIGVIGPNGAGKTTLIRMILGEETPDDGSVELGLNTRIAYFDQLRTQLDPALSVYDSVGGTDWVEVGGRRLHVRTYLEDFLFPSERQQQKVSSLSGGERNRLMLAGLFLQPSNVLILDEPTNDLDIVTLQVLEAALVDYGGCVLMVTHDRFFLDKVATALFVFEGNATVHRHEGGFELYRRLREQKEADAAAARSALDARDVKPRVQRRLESGSAAAKKLSWKEARELEGLSDRIMEMEAERDALSERLADPALYRDPAETARVTAAFNNAKTNVDALYVRWSELEERAG
ncbi:MAG: ABC-F family ATP-binding cassette domain-containing protein [Longimicrobiales bacterium]